MTTRYSLHKIDKPDQFPFAPAEYSRFKFGDELAARKFGTALAGGFIAAHLAEQRNIGQLVVISSPYSFIPTASFALKNYFIFQLNRWLAENNYPVVQEAKAYRTVTYKEDYGDLNAAERLALIGRDEFHIDSVFLKGKTLLFLDDIRITGSHERLILKMAEQYSLTNEMYLLYFAELTNDAIHPNIENYLNFYEIKSIFDLDKIVKSGHFFMNTRFVKYLLCYNADAFRVFIGNQDSAFTETLYDMAIGNNYHTMEAYQTNLNNLREQLFSKHSKLINNGH